MTNRSYQPHQVLLLGDLQAREFRSTVDWLNRRADVTCRPSLTAGVRYLQRAATNPLLIVIVQSYPDQFSARHVEQLHRHSPLSRVVALLGSWCEGELRSGRPWPGVNRLYWHQFESRLASMFDLGDPQSDQVLPRTATIAEQLSEFNPRWGSGEEGLIAIRTAHYCGFDALANALQQIGFATVWLHPGCGQNVRGAKAVVWDGGHCDWSQVSQLAEVTQLSQIAPVIALMDFPRHQDKALIRSAGATAFVSRPFLIDDLLYQISQLDQQAVRDHNQFAA